MVAGMWTQTTHSGQAGDVRNLVQLNDDHPGFHDPTYRRRRDEIAQIALAHRVGDTVPDAPYTSEEQGVWRDVRSRLAPLQARLVCRQLLEAERAFPLGLNRIPQLAEINSRLAPATGFRMEPVTGLVRARTFLTTLGHHVFLSTQYIRHHSRPLYTPEPDIIHELIGHAASLAHPHVARANATIGNAAALADEDELERLERVYWYTFEFGLVEEAQQVKAFGAGLLSSAGELQQIEDGPKLCDWDLDRIAETPYDPTDMQPQLYVAPSFDRLLGDVEAWVLSGAWKSSKYRSRPAAS